MLRKAIISTIILILAATVWEAAGRSSASQPVIPRLIAEGLVTEEKGGLGRETLIAEGLVTEEKGGFGRETFAHRGT